MLINYIRNADRKPHGVVVAFKQDGKIHYGYSLHNPIDKWDRELGIKIAVARANANEFQLPKVDDRHKSVSEAIEHMKTRANKYFNKYFKQ
jgi:hypothetical protein